jgi:hypothetical protein
MGEEVAETWPTGNSGAATRRLESAAVLRAPPRPSQDGADGAERAWEQRSLRLRRRTAGSVALPTRRPEPAEEGSGRGSPVGVQLWVRETHRPGREYGGGRSGSHRGWHERPRGGALEAVGAYSAQSPPLRPRWKATGKGNNSERGCAPMRRPDFFREGKGGPNGCTCTRDTHVLLLKILKVTILLLISAPTLSTSKSEFA